MSWLFSDEWVIGVDEVGVGSIMGPLVACACVLDPDNKELVDEVRDSKKLTEKKRGALATKLQEHCLYEIVSVAPATADRQGVHTARFLAMKTAVMQLTQKLTDIPLIVVDGDTELDLPLPQKAIPKADSKVLAVAAASILAKVHHDTAVLKLVGDDDIYGWTGNKGYGTKQHVLAIAEHGTTPEHRFRIVRNTMRKYWKKQNGEEPVQVVGHTHECLMACANNNKSGLSAEILEPTPGTYQCLMCSYRSGNAGTRTVTDVEIYENIQKSGLCLYCGKKKRRRSLTSCLCINHEPVNQVTLTRYAPHLRFHGGSPFVASFRYGWYCEECMQIHWEVGALGYWRLRKDEVGPTGEFAGRTPRTSI